MGKANSMAPLRMALERTCYGSFLQKKENEQMNFFVNKREFQKDTRDLMQNGVPVDVPVAPTLTVSALQWLLCNGPVFKNAGISENTDWLSILSSSEQDEHEQQFACYLQEHHYSPDEDQTDVQNTLAAANDCESDGFSKIDESETVPST